MTLPLTTRYRSFLHLTFFKFGAVSGPKLKLEADSVMTWDWIFAHFASFFKEELDFNTGVKEAEYGFSFPF